MGLVVIRWIQIGAMASALALAGWGGWLIRDHRVLREAEQLRETQDRREEEISDMESARLADERARVAFDQSMEDSAYADPVRYPDALSADRVRRLRQR